MNNLVILMSIYKNVVLEYFKQSIESILHQSFKQFDMFIKYDGPVDKQIDNYISSINDDRITIFERKENRGLAISLNELIEAALQKNQYKYFARMDADDICRADRLMKQIDFLENHSDVDIISSWCEEIDEENNILFVKKLPPDDATLKRDIIKRNPFNHPAVMARLKIFKEGCRYNPSVYLVEDYKLWTTLAVKGYTFANIQESLLKFRIDRDFYKRRIGLRKAVAEFKVKLIAMKNMKDYRISNFIFLFAYFFMRISPPFVIKKLYRFLR